MNSCLCLASAIAVSVFAASPGDALDRPDAGADPAAQAFRSEPIDAGYVIADARYVPTPYVLERRGEDVLLNGYRVSQLPVRTRSSGRGGGRGRSGGEVAPSDDATAARIDRIERLLNNSAALIISDDGSVAVIRPDDAIWLMQLLNSDATFETKVGHVSQHDSATIGVSVNVWRDLVGRYEISDELHERLEAEFGPYRTFDGIAPRRDGKDESLLSGLVLYGMNVGGMVLVVLAFGALLSRQPPRECQCHTCERCGDGSSFLMRNIGLVVVLSTFDLACTLFAGASGEMLELNPLAVPLLHSPAALAAFKLSATLTGVTILMGLRRHRRAQVASWWLCLVCSLLTFRWVAFHSLFVA